MSLHANFVLVEGDHRRDVERLLAGFGFTFAVIPRTLPSFASVAKTLCQSQVSATVVKKAVGFVRGWTTLYDPERAIAADTDGLRRLARSSRSRVFSMVCDATAGAYGFLFVRGAATRALLTSSDGVVLDVGEPLDEERDVHRESPGEEDVKRVLERVAFPFAAIEEPATWQVLTLSQGPDSNVAHAAGSAHSSQSHWWRFW